MVISGKELSMEMKRQMAVRVKELEQKYGRVPHLVVVLVGEDPGSVSYVAGKAKAADEIGIRNTTIRRPETITEAEMLALIEELNAELLCGFGNLLDDGAKAAVEESGFLGAFTGGATAGAAGISAAVAFGFFAALLSRPGDKS